MTRTPSPLAPARPDVTADGALGAPA
ncbi:MAG: hypothetical protein K0R97_1620, partial [Oerskovia sp.]|nr:hypothetical protein [Oerskovia sp.]